MIGVLLPQVANDKRENKAVEQDKIDVSMKLEVLDEGFNDWPRYLIIYVCLSKQTPNNWFDCCGFV